MPFGSFQLTLSGLLQNRYESANVSADDAYTQIGRRTHLHIILQKPEFGMAYLHILEIVMGYGLDDSSSVQYMLHINNITTLIE
jgi:hypothetical protein